AVAKRIRGTANRFDPTGVRRSCRGAWRRHLRHLLQSYLQYYNDTRTHLSLDKDAPIPRAVESIGCIVSCPLLGGLHHQYMRI
ncbi:MAG: hypothetical protein ACJ72H_00490, partial [Candidatus Sulfotelmatobacter sp.]